jgi:hypothetical protein
VKPKTTTARPTARVAAPAKAKAEAPVKVGLPERRALLNRALDAAIAQRWGGRVTSSSLGGVTVKTAEVTLGRPLWHLLSRGLLTSGFELSLKVPRAKEETAAPAWAAVVLERLIARSKEQPLAEGQVFLLPEPLKTAWAETELAGFAIGVDPELGRLTTAHDTLPVLVAVGVTRDEEKLTREWSPHGLLEVMSKVDPALLTDLERASLLTSPRARQAIEQRVEREGSSMGMLLARVSVASGAERVTWTLDVDAAETVLSLLKGRIGHQRGFVVRSEGFEVELTPSNQPGVTVENGRASLRLTQTTARQIRAVLKPRPGTYVLEAFPALTLEVVGEASSPKVG